jgi:hypothetical protein
LSIQTNKVVLEVQRCQILIPPIHGMDIPASPIVVNKVKLYIDLIVVTCFNTSAHAAPSKLGIFVILAYV